MMASGVNWEEANRLCKLHGASLAKIILPITTHAILSESHSLVSGWLTRAKTNGTIPSNGLNSCSSEPAAPPLRMREHLQLLIRTTRELVDPLRRGEE